MRELDYRIILTENCNANCKHCFNANSRDGKSMDIDRLLEFFAQSQDHTKRSILKIMGGEPTIHPRFEEFVGKALYLFNRISIFTNGTTMSKITKNPIFNRNPNIGFTINGATFDPSTFDQYREFVDKVSIHFVLTMDETDKIVQKALNCAELMGEQATIIYSPDTQVDLFNKSIRLAYGMIWTNAVKTLVPQLRKSMAGFYPDHFLPICFFTPSMIEELDKVDCTDIMKGIAGCQCRNLGLIDTDFDLYYCNQTQIKLGSLLNDDNSFKTMDEIQKMIADGPRTKIKCIEQISKECKECPSLSVCRVACYYNTLKRRIS
jgi:radical SAM protein with 4Fe4S-binding SPASM domain